MRKLVVIVLSVVLSSGVCIARDFDGIYKLKSNKVNLNQDSKSAKSILDSLDSFAKKISHNVHFSEIEITVQGVHSIKIDNSELVIKFDKSEEVFKILDIDEDSNTIKFENNKGDISLIDYVSNNNDISLKYLGLEFVRQ